MFKTEVGARESFSDWEAGRKGVTAAGTSYTFEIPIKVLYLFTDDNIKVGFDDDTKYFQMQAADSPLVIPITCKKLYLKTFSETAEVRFLGLR